MVVPECRHNNLKTITIVKSGKFAKHVLSFKARRCLELFVKPSTVNNVIDFVKMDKIGHHYFIQYFHLKGRSPTNIKAELDSTLGKSVPSSTTIKYWVGEF